MNPHTQDSKNTRNLNTFTVVSKPQVVMSFLPVHGSKDEQSALHWIQAAITLWKVFLANLSCDSVIDLVVFD